MDPRGTVLAEPCPRLAQFGFVGESRLFERLGDRALPSSGRSRGESEAISGPQPRPTRARGLACERGESAFRAYEPVGPSRRLNRSAQAREAATSNTG